MFADVAVEVQDRLVQYLDVLEQAVKTTTDFATEQTPLVVQELILWTRVEATLSTIFLVIVFGAFALCGRALWKAGLKDAKGAVSDMQPEFVIPMVFAIIVALIGTIPTAQCALHCAKTWCAPRLIVLEEVKSLVN